MNVKSHLCLTFSSGSQDVPINLCTALTLMYNLRVKMAGFRAHALRGTVSHKGRLNIAETNGQGRPLSAGDQIFRDTTPCPENCDRIISVY